jgi:hypothetical protein
MGEKEYAGKLAGTTKIAKDTKHAAFLCALCGSCRQEVGKRIWGKGSRKPSAEREAGNTN